MIEAMGVWLRTHRKQLEKLRRNLAMASDELGIASEELTLDGGMLSVGGVGSDVLDVLEPSIEAWPIAPLQLGLFCVSTGELLSLLRRRVTCLVSAALDAIAADASARHSRCVDACDELLVTVESEPSNIEELAAQEEAIGRMGAILERITSEVAISRVMLEEVETFGFAIDEWDFDLAVQARSLPTSVAAAAEDRGAYLDQRRDAFAAELCIEQSEHEAALAALASLADELRVIAESDDAEANYERVLELQRQLQLRRADAERISRREQLMGWPISSHSLLDDIEEEMRPHLALWAAATESQQDIPAWLDGPLEALDAHDVDSKVGAWIRDVSQQLLIFRERGDSAAASACEKTLAALRDFSQHLPVLMCVRAAGMRERHWAMIYERTGIEIRFDDPSLTLSAVLTAGLGEHLFQELLQARPVDRARLHTTWSRWGRRVTLRSTDQVWGRRPRWTFSWTCSATRERGGRWC